MKLSQFLMIAALLFTGVSGAFAADGDLDTTYGSNGITVLPAYSHPVDIAIQSDDKAVVLFAYGNDFGVVRFNTDGSLDTSFAKTGLAVIDFQPPRSIFETQDTPHTILIQPNDKILVAGSTQIQPIGRSDFAIARLNADGTLDTTFGAKGFVRTDFSTGSDIVYDLAKQDNGKIVAVGQALVGGNVKFGIARYKSDGSLDTNFATGGTKTIGFGQADNTAFGIAVQDDGKIVLTGRAKHGVDSGGNPRYVVALARLRHGGGLDPTFGTNGKVRTPFIDQFGTFGDSWAGRAAIQTDGKIVVTGLFPGRFGVARYDTDGSEDTTFGSGGRVEAFGGEDFVSVNRRIALDGGSRIIFGGWGNVFQNVCNPEIFLFRYDFTGTADPTFGSNGETAYGGPFITINSCVTGLTAESFALQSDGKIVTAGDLDINEGLTVARFEN